MPSASETPAKARPRDARATKELLLKAATEEFSEHGLAGARIDRIAERAGANKRLLYMYFGDKDQLFDAVVARQIDAVMNEVPLEDGDLVAFAMNRFDYVLNHPQVGRIATWRTLERAEPADDERRGFEQRISSVAKAQAAGRLRSDIPAIDLFAIVLRMTEGWLSAAPALKAAAGTAPMSPRRIREHRASLETAVRSVIQPV
jgi:AcrR family transcriptional regulator